MEKKHINTHFGLQTKNFCESNLLHCHSPKNKFSSIPRKYWMLNAVWNSMNFFLHAFFCCLAVWWGSILYIWIVIAIVLTLVLVQWSNFVAKFFLFFLFNIRSGFVCEHEFLKCNLRSIAYRWNVSNNVCRISTGIYFDFCIRMTSTLPQFLVGFYVDQPNLFLCMNQGIPSKLLTTWCHNKFHSTNLNKGDYCRFQMLKRIERYIKIHWLQLLIKYKSIFNLWHFCKVISW